MQRRVLLVCAWTAIACAIAELCAREVARRSLFGHLTGFSPGTLSLLMAIAAGLWGAAVFRRGTLLFATLFAVGLAAQIQLGARLQSDGFYYYAYLRSI